MTVNRSRLIFLTLALCTALPVAAMAAETPSEKVVVIDGLGFDSMSEYINSNYFKSAGKRCGTPPPALRPGSQIELLGGGGGGSDCLAGSTNPTATYDPGPTYVIRVVVHIIQSTGGQGVISDAMVNSQIAILNEDFMATAGTPGANGNVGGIQFALATEDVIGGPTTGILRYTNDSWFNDDPGYTANAWDTNRYMNIYTNLAGGNLGYVPDFPQNGIVGTAEDRVVILWDAFGRNAPIGPPYDQGRTSTHEVGHWIALEHTFNGGCASAGAPGCYSDGDVICDTNPEANSAAGCSDPASCSTSDPIDNYMDYSDDTCMQKFTVEQVRRMRCTLQYWRPNVFTTGNGASEIFSDDFETGNTNNWTQ